MSTAYGANAAASTPEKESTEAEDAREGMAFTRGGDPGFGLSARVTARCAGGSATVPEDMRALHGANAHLDECTNLVADPTSKHETQTTSATDHPTLHAADR